MSAVTTKLVRIGNSRGVRIPKALLQEVGLTEAVELEARDGELVLRPVPNEREGWDAAFAEMAARGDDALLDADNLPDTEWDQAEWQW